MGGGRRGRRRRLTALCPLRAGARAGARTRRASHTTLRHGAQAAAEALAGRGVEAAKAAAAVTSMNDIDYGALSVSALDRCAPCMDAQDEELRRRPAPPARMQAADPA